MVSRRLQASMAMRTAEGNTGRRGESPVASAEARVKLKKKGLRQKQDKPVHQGGAL